MIMQLRMNGLFSDISTVVIVHHHLISNTAAHTRFQLLLLLAVASPTLLALPNPRKAFAHKSIPPAPPSTPAAPARDFPIPEVSASNWITFPTLPSPSMVKWGGC